MISKNLNLTIDEENEFIKSVENFLWNRRRNKYSFPFILILYSFIFATGLIENIFKLNFN